MSSGSGPGPIPPRWLLCPRKSVKLVGSKFLAFKTPLDPKYDDQVAPQHRFPPQMMFDSMKSYNVKVGLWIDLCNTSRFYDSASGVERADNGCRYWKMRCKGRGATPDPEQVQLFVSVCQNFLRQHPLEVIAVHCTHGFNRTGFLTCAYLIEVEDWSPEAAVQEFATARPPGIYKDDYLQELFRRYGDVTDAPAAPPLPDWCYEEDDERGVDEDGHALQSQSQNGASAGGSGDAAGSARRRRELVKKNPTFMTGVSGVQCIIEQPNLSQIQQKVQDMCHWKKSGFPGAQPVSMTQENLRKLTEQPYKVSWKADGTRYMMLINGRSKIYFIDRDNCVFKVENLTFLHRKIPNKHLCETLLDGEMVIDEVNGQSFPRYLVYDIIRYEGEEVGSTNFSTRLLCIDKEIIQTRAKYMQEGKIDKSRESFSVRQKQFWSLSDTRTLLGPKFTKESLGHEPDGLIFQPSGKDVPYVCGRDDNILKWKPSTHNSVDFKLVVHKETQLGMLPEVTGLLYVGGQQTPFAQIKKLKKELRELNNKIIECTWDAQKNEWAFMRERTDKSYPNALKTANGVIKSIRFPVTEEMLLRVTDRCAFKRPASTPTGHAHHQNSMSKQSPMMPPPPKNQRMS